MSNEIVGGIVKKVEISVDENQRIDVDIKMNLSMQNFLHFELCINAHYESQSKLMNKEQIKKWGDVSELYDYLGTLRDKLREEFNSKYAPSKEW